MTSHYWQQLWRAILGQSQDGSAEADKASQVAMSEPELRLRIGALEADRQDRDQRIAQMQAEYVQLQATAQCGDAAARQAELERLFKRLVGTLSNLAALAGMAQAGREVETADVLELVDALLKELHRAGLEMIGQSGTLTTFDVAEHQRLSGGAVHAGTAVTIQIPGFRCGEKVLLKAMVSTRE